MGTNNWQAKRVAVTGAGGFIGSHLVDALVRAGAEVTAIVRYNSGARIGNLDFLDPEVRAAMTIAFGNIEDSDFIYQTLEGKDVVLHLGALIAIPYSYEAPRSYVRANIEGTLNVLQAGRRSAVGRIVHTSTSEVYGTALRTPIDESHPLQGQSPYSASKIAADKLAESYCRSFELPVVTLRPFNTYGPRQSARAFIPTIISQAFARDEIRLGSLTPERDMTYVSDTVAGFLAAGSQPGIEGMTINLGTGETYSVGWFASRILSLMGVDKPIVTEAQRLRPEQSEVLKLISDNSLAQRAGLGAAHDHRRRPLPDDRLRALQSRLLCHRPLHHLKAVTRGLGTTGIGTAPRRGWSTPPVGRGHGVGHMTVTVAVSFPRGDGRETSVDYSSRLTPTDACGLRCPTGR